MSWPTVFAFTNLVAVAAWLALATLPRRPLILSLVLFAGVALLCAAYAAGLVALVAGGVDPGQVPGAPPYDAADYSIAGLRKLFGSDAGLVLGWTHYLAFDLFVGLWIARDADGRRVGRLVQLPFLLLTFLAGPLGLLAWLLGRRWLTRRRGDGTEARA